MAGGLGEKSKNNAQNQSIKAFKPLGDLRKKSPSPIEGREANKIVRDHSQTQSPERSQKIQHDQKPQYDQTHVRLAESEATQSSGVLNPVKPTFRARKDPDQQSLEARTKRISTPGRLEALSQALSKTSPEKSSFKKFSIEGNLSDPIKGIKEAIEGKKLLQNSPVEINEDKSRAEKENFDIPYNGHEHKMEEDQVQRETKNQNGEKDKYGLPSVKKAEYLVPHSESLDTNPSEISQEDMEKVHLLLSQIRVDAEPENAQGRKEVNKKIPGNLEGDPKKHQSSEKTDEISSNFVSRISGENESVGEPENSGYVFIDAQSDKDLRGQNGHSPGSAKSLHELIEAEFGQSLNAENSEKNLEEHHCVNSNLEPELSHDQSNANFDSNEVEHFVQDFLSRLGFDSEVSIQAKFRSPSRCVSLEDKVIVSQEIKGLGNLRLECTPAHRKVGSRS